MDKVAVSRALALLLERGLAERELHGDDRRRSVLRLSRAGRRIYAEVAPLALQLEAALLEPLDATERAQLDTLLSKLADGIRHLR